MGQVNPKKIVIVGSGITGLTLLHYLKEKYKGRDEVAIELFERKEHPGGTVRTLEKDGTLFETGPNGFLGTKPQTFQLVKEIGLEGQLVVADEGAKQRFISLNDELIPFPLNPKSFLSFVPLNIFEKMRVFMEPFVRKGELPSESIYEFAARRFGRKIADFVLDPFVSGIYAGDAKQICVQSAFPKLHQWEQQYGSILKGAIAERKKKKAEGGKRSDPRLHSFKKGMQQIIDRLYDLHKKNIYLNKEIIKTFHRKERYVLSTQKENFKANELFICTPAYAAAQMIGQLDKEIADDLMYINYAPVVVVGVLTPNDIFQQPPKGFGYLIPSSENKEILGVLFEHNIYPHRVKKNRCLFRLMIGGARHPDIHQRSKKELIELCFQELERTFPTKGNTPLTKINLRKVTEQTFIKVWEKAIPQYDQINLEMNKHIDEKLKRFRDLYFLGNYRGGVSFNDCITNAYQCAQQSSL